MSPVGVTLKSECILLSSLSKSVSRELYENVSGLHIRFESSLSRVTVLLTTFANRGSFHS